MNNKKPKNNMIGMRLKNEDIQRIATIQKNEGDITPTTTAKKLLKIGIEHYGKDKPNDDFSYKIIKSANEKMKLDSNGILNEISIDVIEQILLRLIKNNNIADEVWNLMKEKKNEAV